VAGKVLPDTNAFIALSAGNASIRAALDDADEIILAAAVLGELRYGALNSGSPERNLDRVNQIAALCTFAPVDVGVVQRYAEIRAALKRRGRPIPENDIWIAATAQAHGAVVMTDDAHFEQIADLLVVKLP
jgi:tRNA(fMet)-specific endonuclease VapC